jgi:hypothetical protein
VRILVVHGGSFGSFVGGALSFGACKLLSY